MVAWLLQYWWAIFGVVGMFLYVGWRMHVERTEGPLLRRLLYVFVPAANPKSSKYQPITSRMAWLMGIGFVLVMLANLWLGS